MAWNGAYTYTFSNAHSNKFGRNQCAFFSHSISWGKFYILITLQYLFSWRPAHPRLSTATLTPFICFWGVSTDSQGLLARYIGFGLLTLYDSDDALDNLDRRVGKRREWESRLVHKQSRRSMFYFWYNGTRRARYFLIRVSVERLLFRPCLRGVLGECCHGTNYGSWCATWGWLKV